MPGKSSLSGKPEGRCASDGRCRVDFFAQKHWTLVANDIADEAASGSGECPHEDGNEEAAIDGLGLGCTDDGEQREIGGVNPD